MSYVAGASLGNGQVRTFHFKRSWTAGANICGKEGEGLGWALSLSSNGNRLTVTTTKKMYVFDGAKL